MNKEELELLSNILLDRIGKLECPMCHHNHFTLGTDYAIEQIYEDYVHKYSSGKGMPVVMLICDNCGFVSYHALGTLGLLKQPNSKV